jgi:hypothetical protein
LQKAVWPAICLARLRYPFVALPRPDHSDIPVIARPADAVGRWLRWRLLAPLPGYALLVVVLFRDAWRSPASIVVGNGQDPPFFIWSYSWFPFALRHSLQPLISTYLDYPSGINLMGSTSAPLLSVVLWPVTSTWGPVVAYNVSITAGVALSAWCACLLCSRIVGGLVSPAIAGLIYGFSPFMIGHSLGHPHLVAAVFPPLLGLLAYDMLTREPALYRGILLGLALAAQLYVSEELLAMEMLAALLGLVIGASVFPGEWRRRIKSCVRPAAIALAISTALSAIPVGIQFFGQQHVGGTVNPRGFYVSDLLGFFVPTHLQWLSPAAAAGVSQRFTGNPAEWGAYIGVPLLLVAGYVTVSEWRRSVVRIVAPLAFLLSLLSLGPTLHVGGVITPIPSVLLGLGLLAWRRHVRVGPILVVLTVVWASIAVAPLIGDILPARLMLLVFLLLAILVAFFLRALPQQSVEKRVAGVLAMATVLLALAPVSAMPSTAYAIPAFFQGHLSSELGEASVVLVAPYAYGWDDLAMVWQATAGMTFKMPEGYGTLPGPSLNPLPTELGDEMIAIDQGAPYEGISQQSRARMLSDLGKWRVEAVVVGPMTNQAAMVRFISDLLGFPPQAAGGILIWHALKVAE